jgi:hypothetical protein
MAYLKDLCVWRRLQYTGISESKARVRGNDAAFLVNMGISITPTKVAAVAVNYLAGRAGLWAEKGLMRRVFGKKETHSDPINYIKR